MRKSHMYTCTTQSCMVVGQSHSTFIIIMKGSEHTSFHARGTLVHVPYERCYPFIHATLTSWRWAWGLKSWKWAWRQGYVYIVCSLTLGSLVWGPGSFGGAPASLHWCRWWSPGTWSIPLSVSPPPLAGTDDSPPAITSSKLITTDSRDPSLAQSIDRKWVWLLTATALLCLCSSLHRLSSLDLARFTRAYSVWMISRCWVT